MAFLRSFLDAHPIGAGLFAVHRQDSGDGRPSRFLDNGMQRECQFRIAAFDRPYPVRPGCASHCRDHKHRECVLSCERPGLVDARMRQSGTIPISGNAVIISPRLCNVATSPLPPQFRKATEMRQSEAVRCESSASTTLIDGPAPGRHDLKYIDSAKGWAQVMQTGRIGFCVDNAGAET